MLIRFILLVLLTLPDLGLSQADVEDIEPMWPSNLSDEEKAKWMMLPGVNRLPDFHSRQNEFSLRRDPLRKRNYWWPALVSIPLPGFGQYYESQHLWGAGYSAAAGAGFLTFITNPVVGQKDHETEEEFVNRMTHGVTERRALYGLQVYQTSGGLSAYHYFRTAVRSQQAHGNFLFLEKEETIGDILYAPLRFEFVKRPSTFIPLGIAGALYFVITEGTPRWVDDVEKDRLDSSDVFFASAFSLNAGTHEEAVFRGWLQPMAMHWFDSKFWANALASGVFAAAHLSDANTLPLPQLLLGFHLGQVTMENDWTLAESIFIHTWWDVIVFMAQYQVKLEDSSSKIEPALHLPPFEWRF